MLEFLVTTAMGDDHTVSAKDHDGARRAINAEIRAQGDDDWVEAVDLAPGQCASRLWPAPWHP